MKEEITQRAFVPLIVPFSLHSSLNPTSSLILTPQELVLVYLPKKLNTSTETELQLRAEKPFENHSCQRNQPNGTGRHGPRQREKQDVVTSPQAVPSQLTYLGRGAGSAGRSWAVEGPPPGCTPTVPGGLREPAGTAAGSRWEALCISWPVHIPKIHSKKKC